MRSLNVRLVLLLAVLAVGSLVGIFLLHRFQVNRNAGSLAKIARLRIKEGRRDEGINLLARYVNYRPGDREALAELAGLLLDKAETPNATRNDIGRAFTALESAVRKDPDNAALRRRLAEFDIKIGRFSDARQHLQILREAAPDTARVQEQDPKNTSPAKDSSDRNAIDLLLARSWAGTGDFEEAATLAAGLIGFEMETKAFAEDAVERHGAVEAYVLLAAILDEKFGDKTSAAAVLDGLTKARPDDVKAWLALTSWQRQRGDLPAAKLSVAKATELAPKDAETLLAAFEVAMAGGDFGQASRLSEQGIELFPDDERMVRAAAALAMQERQPQKAIELLDKAIAGSRGGVGLLLMLADALLQTNDLPRLQKTIGQLREAIGKSSPAVMLLEARALLIERRWPDAKEKLEQVRPLVAASEELTRQVDLYLGQCFEQLGQFDEQLEANRRVLTDAPASLAARVGAASALLAGGKLDEARQEFELVAATIPEDQLPSIPQVWSPLLQLRMSEQMERPASDRDWSKIDSVLEILQESKDISAPQIALLRADVLVRKGESAVAIETLETALETTPNEAQLWTALATLTLREKDAPAALAVLARAPKEIADHPAVLLVTAQLVSRGSKEEADRGLADLEARARSLPADQAGRVLTTLGSIRLSLGEAAEAERLWTESLERTTDDARLLTALFDLACDQGDVDKARGRATDIAIAAGATSPQARVAQASTRILQVRKAQKAKAAAGETTELDAAQTGLLDEARNLLIEAENDRPGWAQIQQVYAEIATLRGDIPSAIERLERANRMGPANPAIVRQLATLLYASNRLDEAQQALARLGPDGLGGFDRISAELELRSGKLDEAVAIAERSVASDSTNAMDLLWLGQLLSRSGKTDRAEGVLERAVAAAPEQPETWLTLFSHQLTNGRRNLAEQTLEKASRQLPESKRFLVTAQGSEMLGKLDDAEAAYREAAADGDLSNARSLAGFLVRRGRLNPAREELRRIIDADGDDAATRAAKVWARRTLAQLTADSGGYKGLQQAIELLEANAGKDGRLGPEDVSMQVALLASRSEPASWRQAIELLESLGKIQPLSLGQRLQLAQLREKAGRWEEARSDLVTLMAAPNIPPTMVAVLVERLIEHDETSSARIWLDRLRKTSADAPITIALEARLAMAEDDRPRAVAAARKLMPSGAVPLEQVPQLKSIAKLMEDLGFAKAADKVLGEFAGRSTDGVLARAEFLGRQKRSMEALDLLETAWSRVPLERVMQTALVAIRGGGERPSAEVTSRLDGWFEKALREDPDSVVLVLLQTELLDLQGRTEEVEKTYRSLLARPDLPPMQSAIIANNLAFHLARAGTTDEARRLIDSAISELGPNPDLLDTRGIVRLASGDVRKAVEDLEEAALDPTAIKFFHLAVAQATDGQVANAKKTLERANKLGLKPFSLPPADRARLERLESILSEKAGSSATPATSPAS